MKYSTSKNRIGTVIKYQGTGLVVRRLGGELSPPNRVVFLVVMISFWVAKTKEKEHQM